MYHTTCMIFYCRTDRKTACRNPAAGGDWSPAAGGYGVPRGGRAWSMEHGAWSMEHGAWSMGHGAWSVEHGVPQSRRASARGRRLVPRSGRASARRRTSGAWGPAERQGIRQEADKWGNTTLTFFLSPLTFFNYLCRVIDGGQICADCNHGKKC